MPRHSSKRKRPAKPPQQSARSKFRPDPPNSLYGTKRFELVDPRWIVKALAITLAAAALFGYLLVCALFWHGQWQLVLDPSPTVSTTPAADGLPFTEVHFGSGTSGQPQLDGWWIPSQPSATATASTTLLTTHTTALLLHSGHGSMSDALPAALALHQAGLNVLLFDYRGFGHSAGPHPTQASMQSDASSALRYLNATRNVPLWRIVVYGSGVGASLATALCAQNSTLPALILEAPQGDLMAQILRDPRSSLVPARLLFHETFPLAAPLANLRTPKLLISVSATGQPPTVFSRAADPKITVELPSKTDGSALQQALQRFLDTYLSSPEIQPQTQQKMAPKGV